jgi:Protein of unknown function (DUF732)
MRAPRFRPIGALPPVLRAVVLLAVVALVVLAVAGCSGGRGDRESVIPDAQLLPSGPPPTIEAHIRARPWASSKVRIQAWGGIWREQTRNPEDRERGIDATNWAIRTCDAVRTNGKAPEAMVRRIRDQAKFTQQGARVIVTAALQVLCPAQSALNPFPP